MKTKLLCLSLITSFLFLGLNSCKKEETRAKRMPPSVSSFVYAYTNGVISKAAPVKVRFTQAVASAEEVGKEPSSTLLLFSPSVAGKAYWEDESTLTFQPESYFESGQAYVATMKLGKLFTDVPKDAKSFEFDFRTKDLTFQVEILGLEAPDHGDLSKQQIVGTLNTSDIATVQEIEQVLTAQQNGNNLDIAWNHDGKDNQHTFYIKNVKRGNGISEVNLSWNGRAMNVTTTGEQKIEIPSLTDFKVMYIQLKNDEGQYLAIHFSDPLLKAQNLDGLIRINDYRGQLRFVIDGNEVKVYPSERPANTKRLVIAPGIKNVNNAKLSNPSEWDVDFEVAKPKVRIAGKGVIMPNSEGLIFPFEAISLNAVEVEVFKIFNNNILQFLQYNELNGSSDLERVGRVVLQEKVPLKNLNPSANTSQWTRYALDLSTLMRTDPDAIYQIRLGFRPEYSTYACGEDNVAHAQLASLEEDESDLDSEIRSIFQGWYGIYGRYEGYRWEHRTNPCFPAYYSPDNFAKTNVIASNLGIIAKGGKDNSLFVAVSDLTTTNAIAGASLEIYDYQQQLMKTVETDGDGTARIDLSRKPFVVVAKKGDQKGYLRVLDGAALSISRFDVSGAVTQKGLKGYIYGERGVWRPGDSLYLNFMLEDETGRLPASHPITFELYDPRGQLQEKRISSESVENIYPLPVGTSVDVPTGNWIAKVKVGGATFTKSLKIETVKPNRLKINLDFGKEELSSADEPLSADLQVNWLHGAPARNLKAKVEVNVNSTNTKFDKYPNFEFDDPARSIYSEPRTVFDGQVDDNGYTRFTTTIYNGENAAPGKMVASFKTRAFESGGDFSTDNYSVAYSPYTAYTGIAIPKNKYGQKRFDMNTSGTIEFAVVGENGEPVANRNVKVGMYRVNWRWWWDRDRENVSRYNSSSHFDAQETANLTTDGNGVATWNVSVSDWGRYLVRVCDTQSGHCSGDFFYSGYPWNDSNGGDRSQAAIMAFSSDKESYQVDETIQLKVPAGEVGRVLITLETGTKVIESRWENAKKGDNTYKFYATKDMAPTVYAHVSLMQPHGQANNDLPIRMYGVIPIRVEDPATILKPQIKMPEVLTPEQIITVEVSEDEGQDMSYTLAMVDEGLLDLTRFKTPNPHNVFYAREALGVKTWDVYDYVLGAYGGELERVLSIGGDGDLQPGDADKTANRFEPVVRHLGPFYLEKGQTAKHQITMPNYVGSVRTMVVAANMNGAYGNSEKTTPVRQPLMVLATLPRVLGPGEQLKLPVNVFAMEKNVKNVNVRIEESSGLVTLKSDAPQALYFEKPGDQIADFDIQIGENVGIARFKITATGGGKTATQEIEIDVRNPNPYVTNVLDATVKAGEEWNSDFAAAGMYGTNTGVLEVSSIPPLNLGERLPYLIRYPYGCLEQTTSSGFPQLYVDRLLELDADQKRQVPQNIAATINRLKNFQTNEGGFAYWPGENYVNEWACNYAGHFLLEAKELGYSVPIGMLTNWIKFQKKAAKIWTPELRRYGYTSQYGDHEQAYRLYTLALAKSADLGAMNRLREKAELSTQAKWRLAAAYALTGKTEVAKDIIKDVPITVEDYRELSHTFGSNVRDVAMILETAVLLDDGVAINQLVRDVAKSLSARQWLSTQETAYSLLAIGKFAKANKMDNRVQFAYQIGGSQMVDAGSTTPMMQIDVPVDKTNNKSIRVKNSSKGTLFARLILTGQPLVGEETAASNNLQIEVVYKNSEGNNIDPTSISQGTDFVAEVTVTHPGTRGITFDEMALSQIFPSGWEIINTRMDNANFTPTTSTRPTNAPQPYTPSTSTQLATAQAEYRDVRDDRVFTHFDIRPNTKQVYRVALNAAYQGRYYLPAVSCGAMYDESVLARVVGTWVVVVGDGES